MEAEMAGKVKKSSTNNIHSMIAVSENFKHAINFFFVHPFARPSCILVLHVV